MPRSIIGPLAAGLAALAVAAGPAAIASTTPAPPVVAGTHCSVFPADNVWNAPINKLPVLRYSASWLAHMQTAGRDLHPDFGPSYGAQPLPYGIPITVVSGSHPLVRVVFQYANESNQVLYPLGPDTLIEGGWNSTGDRHAVVVDAATCELYETWNTRDNRSGWTAGSGATWSLKSDALRPAGWTSADAAGLPILPGLVTWAQVRSGTVDHAIRFTTPWTCTGYVWPARHEAGSQRNCALYPPMGARFRLNANFPMTGFSAQAQVVLRAMKTYGLILADNGSAWYFQGSADTGWPAALIDQLKRIPASAFQAVDESSLMISANSAATR